MIGHKPSRIFQTKSFLFTLICFVLNYCRIEHDPTTKVAIDHVTKNLESKIIVVYLNEENQQNSSLLRHRLVEFSSKASRFKPEIIFFNLYFLKLLGWEEEFAKSLNKNMPTISEFLLKKKIGNSASISDFKYLYSNKISASNRFNQEVPWVYNEMLLPDKNIVLKSEKICPYILDSNHEDGGYFVSQMLPVIQFGDYLIENCPLVIANTYLNRYGININYDAALDRYSLYSFLKSNLGPIHYLDSGIGLYSNNRKIIFREFRSLSLDDFLYDSSNKFQEGSIFIVGGKSIKFQTKEGEIDSTMFIASEVYTLINSISRRMTYLNKIDQQRILLGK